MAEWAAVGDADVSDGPRVRANDAQNRPERKGAVRRGVRAGIVSLAIGGLVAGKRITVVARLPFQHRERAPRSVACFELGGVGRRRVGRPRLPGECSVPILATSSFPVPRRGVSESGLAWLTRRGSCRLVPCARRRPYEKPPDEKPNPERAAGHGQDCRALWRVSLVEMRAVVPLGAGGTTVPAPGART